MPLAAEALSSPAFQAAIARQTSLRQEVTAAWMSPICLPSSPHGVRAPIPIIAQPTLRPLAATMSWMSQICWLLLLDGERAPELTFEPHSFKPRETGVFHVDE